MHNCKAAHGTKAYSPILPTKHDKAKSCDKPCCEVCLLGKQHQQTPGSVTVKAKPEKEMAIRQDNLIPGDCISLNQFESSARKRLPHTFGKETSSIHYVGELLGIDQSSGYVFLRNQVSLRSGNIVRSMREFEKEALQCGVKFKKFHADNFPFNSEEFKAHVQDRPQTFSGVGAHHQSAAIECCIKTISYLCRSVLMHQLLHWPAAFEFRVQTLDNPYMSLFVVILPMLWKMDRPPHHCHVTATSHLALWPFAMEQAVFLWKHMPNERNRLAPVELFTSTKFHSYDALSRARVWGAPTYVLSPKLQDSHMLPNLLLDLAPHTPVAAINKSTMTPMWRAAIPDRRSVSTRSNMPLSKVLIGLRLFPSCVPLTPDLSLPTSPTSTMRMLAHKKTGPL